MRVLSIAKWHDPPVDRALQIPHVGRLELTSNERGRLDALWPVRGGLAMLSGARAVDRCGILSDGRAAV